MPRPLLTLALVTYNQERFIAQAVQSAFDQTYSPLEIILSDDASTDATFSIMREMAAHYRGPHRIVLNRNDPNIGLARHVNQIARIARGELVIAAAGDDLSVPERAEILFKAWDGNDRRATCLHSRVAHIGPDGEPASPPPWERDAGPTHRIVTQTIPPLEYVKTQRPDVLGCTCAWAPSLFKIFGDLPDDVVHEDNAVVMRSLIQSRSILFIDTPLVRYRVHGGNLFNSRDRRAATLAELQAQARRMRRGFARRAVMYRVFAYDLRTAVCEKMIAEDEYYPAYFLARQRERLLNLQSDYMAAGVFRKAGLLAQFCFTGLDGTRFGKLAVRLLPMRVLQALKVTRAVFSKAPREIQPKEAHPVCE